MQLPRRPAKAGLLATGASFVACTALFFLASPPLSRDARADESAALAPKKLAWAPWPILKEFPDFEAKDLEGKTFRLSAARSITKDSAFAGVADLAKARGAKEPKREDPIDGLEGVKGDPEARLAFLEEALRPHGMIAGVETSAAWKTLGDLSDAIAASADAPIVFLVWSSKCPTSRTYEPRILEIFGATGARVYPLASSGVGETDDEARGFLEGEGLPYRVLLDRDQAVCDRLGGMKTPHAFLLDKRNRLRYAGMIDDDPNMEKDDAAARRNYLRDAIEQVKLGGEVDVWMTAPKG